MKLKGKPRTARIVGGALLLAALLTLGLVALLELPDIAMAAIAVLGFALLIAGALVFLLFWRCTYCGRALPGTLGLEHCPFCGSKIEDDA